MRPQQPWDSGIYPSSCDANDWSCDWLSGGRTVITSPVFPETARIPFWAGLLAAAERVTMAAWLPTPEVSVAVKVLPCACAVCCSPASTIEMNDVVIAPVAMSTTTTCALPEYVQTIPEVPAGRSAAGCEFGAARVSPRSELTVPSLGQVRLDNAEVGVAVGAAVGLAVEGAEVEDVAGAEVDALVEVVGELPHATSVAANATDTTAAKRSGVRM